MEIILNILLPVFGIAAMGYAAVRLGWFSESAEAGVSTFIFNFAVPFMMFRTIARTDLPDRIPFDLFGTYYLPALIVFGIGLVMGRRVFGRDWSGAILTGMGGAFSNTVLLGLPIVVLAYGEEGALPFFLILSVHGLVMFTGTTILLEVAKSSTHSASALIGEVVSGLVRNPILIGIFFGIVTNLTGIGIAEPLDRIAQTMQGAVLPGALFVLGASLSRYGIAGRLTQSAFLVLMKLAVFPALVFVFGTYLFAMDPHWTAVAVITAAQPVGVMVYLFASRYGTTTALATTTIFLTTVLSVATNGLILWFFGV
ncbi:MAG: AEC family transporter [Alphaproteobacteria bacterium]